MKAELSNHNDPQGLLRALLVSTASTAAPMRPRSDLPQAAIEVIPSSPVGPVLAALSQRGVAMIHFLRHPADVSAAIARLRRRFDPVPETGASHGLRDELNGFAGGDLTALRSNIDLSLVAGSFQKRILELLIEVGAGALVTYSSLAAWAGAPEASRAVGAAMHDNPIPVYVPCHRVVRSDLSLGGYGGGLEIKRKLLSVEGFTFAASGRVSEAGAVWGNRATKIFCRPECHWVARARRTNLVLFRDRARAVEAGMRPCSRCRMFPLA